MLGDAMKWDKKDLLQGAIFDVDGTLLDSMPIWDNAAALYLKTRGISAPPELGRILYPMTMREGSEYLREKYKLTPHVDEIMQGVNETIQNFYQREVLLKSGVAEFLHQLKQRKIRMTIATSSDRLLIEKALLRLQILDCFDRLFTCSELGVGKDKPDIYVAAQEFMGTKRPATWVFEDAPHAIRTAKTAGFQTVGIYDASSAAQQEEIKRYSDIYMEKKMSFKDFVEKGGNYENSINNRRK